MGALLIDRQHLETSGDEREGIGTANPCKGVKTVRPSKRERYLSGEEMRRLFTAADELVAEDEIAAPFAAAIRFMALTGARRTEILELRWSEVDHAANVAARH